MRKTVLFFLFMGLASWLHAGPVSPEEAIKVAERVFASQPYTKATQGNFRIIWDGEFEATKGAENPDFYVVGRDVVGFVIVAGNNNVRPVLGLSFENSFKLEGMPCNVEAFMRGLKHYCQTAQTDSLEIQELWDMYLTVTKSALPMSGITNEFLDSRTALWNQDGPANLKCPIVKRQHNRAVCGCVPLAYAEVMTWFGHPQKGTGTVEGYTYETRIPNVYETIPPHDLGTEYDWDGLQQILTPEQFYAEEHTELGENLGQLVYDIGTIFQASYNDDGTGASSYYMDRLCNMLGYNRGVRDGVSSRMYPAILWDEVLRDEVTKHPVCTGGWGHAYVMDGFATYNNTDLVFHYNMGWAGSCNGYYYSDIQEAYDDPSEDFHNGGVVLDFYPDYDGSSEFITNLAYYEEEEWGWDVHAGIALSPESPTIQVGEWFLLLLNGLANIGTAPFYGNLGAFRVKASGERDLSPLGEFTAFEETDPLLPWYICGYGWWFQAPVQLSFGDRIVWYYQQKDKDYKPLEARFTGAFLDEMPVFPAAMIRLEPSYSVNDIFYFHLINNDYTYPDAVWHITAPSGQTTDYPQSYQAIRLSEKGKYTVKVTTEKETIVAKITVN